MKLSLAQKREFWERGYVKIPGCIPQVMVNEAVKAINASIGKGMNVADMPIFQAQSFCPDIKNTPVISDLLNKTPAWTYACDLLGEENIRPAGGGQVAVRFPTMRDPAGKAGPHLDGMYSPTNGVPEGTIQSFSLLVGVLLSDLPNPDSGNFTPWPGTHTLYESYFREHGPESLLEGMPPIDIGEAEQVTGKAGDVVLVHYQVAHGVTPNASPHPRYACFFRLKHAKHEWKTALTNIWTDYPGMEAVRQDFEAGQRV